MSKTIAAHQSNFMQNLSYFHKMWNADVFVLITNIQFEREEGWQRRNRIPTKNGDLWLTVPVFGSQNQVLRDVKIDHSKNWAKKHIKTLQYNYAKSKEPELLKKTIEIYNSKQNRLAELNIKLILLIKEFLEIPTELIIDEEIRGEKHELLINICKKYNAENYLSGKGAKHYIDEEYLKELEKNNIKNIIMENNLAKEYPYSIMNYIL